MSIVPGKGNNVPGWNAHVREVHAASRDAYLLWKIGGRPREGVLYDLMRNSRLRFKHALRLCKNNKNAIIADKIADNLSNKDDRTFWREIKNVTNSKVPSRIGDVHVSNAVAGIWKEHYSSIFNTVNGSNFTELHAELCVAHCVYDTSISVSPSEITEIINALPCNKSPGLDGVTSEHLKYASSQLSVLLSIMSAILVHGRVRSAMLKSVMIPIVKNKNKHITDKENYRPIRLANVFTKVIENVLLSHLQNWLSTTCSQFGFKAKHGTDMCVFILKETHTVLY